MSKRDAFRLMIQQPAFLKQKINEVVAQLDEKKLVSAEQKASLRNFLYSHTHQGMQETEQFFAIKALGCCEAIAKNGGADRVFSQHFIDVMISTMITRKFEPPHHMAEYVRRYRKHFFGQSMESKSVMKTSALVCILALIILAFAIYKEKSPIIICVCTLVLLERTATIIKHGAQGIQQVDRESKQALESNRQLVELVATYQNFCIIAPAFCSGPRSLAAAATHLSATFS